MTCGQRGWINKKKAWKCDTHFHAFARLLTPFSLFVVRQCHVERTARAYSARDLHTASSLRDDHVDRRESQAGALSWRFGGEEGLERTQLRRLVHPYAGVLDPQPHDGPSRILA